MQKKALGNNSLQFYLCVVNLLKGYLCYIFMVFIFSCHFFYGALYLLVSSLGVLLKLSFISCILSFI